MLDGYIEICDFKFDELKLDSLEKYNANNYEYEHLKFSELSIQHEGEYQLEKGSILFKIKTDDFKQKFEESEKEYIKWKTKKTLKNFINRINNIENLKIEESIKDFFERITKIEESIKDYIERITKIEELKNKWGIRMNK